MVSYTTSPIFSIVQSQCLQHMHSSAADMTSNCLQEHHSSNDGIIGLNDLLSAGRFSTSSVDSESHDDDDDDQGYTDIWTKSKSHGALDSQFKD